MVVLLAAMSTVIGVAVAHGRNALLPSTVLVVSAYVVARHSGTRPAVVAGAAAVPAITMVMAFGKATLAEAWLFHGVALVTFVGVTWLLARR